MKKKLFSIITAVMIIGGISYNSYATVDAGCFYRKYNCIWNDNVNCWGSGDKCPFDENCRQSHLSNLPTFLKLSLLQLS
jgi:hypothetical protein